MKFSSTLTLICACLLPSMVWGQAISGYFLNESGGTRLEVSSLFDQDGIGPVLQDNSSVTLFVPTERVVGSPENAGNGGVWFVTAYVPLSETCGVVTGDLANYSLLQMSLSQSNQFFPAANLGQVYEGVPELLFALPLTGESGRPVYGYQPTGSDALSSCVRSRGADNTATIDPDGRTNSPFGTRQPVGYSNIPIFSAQANLPVELLAFSATANGDHSALLEWTTEQEVDLAGYAVERSANGQNWDQIGFVSATGDAGYAFVDEAALDGLNYYRLKMLDVDGAYRYSEVVSVAFGASAATLTVYPNPATNEVTIITNAVEEDAELWISDPGGRIVWSAKVAVGHTYQSVFPARDNLPAGVYQVSMLSQQRRLTERLVVLR